MSIFSTSTRVTMCRNSILSILGAAMITVSSVAIAGLQVVNVFAGSNDLKALNSIKHISFVCNPSTNRIKLSVQKGNYDIYKIFTLSYSGNFKRASCADNHYFIHAISVNALDKKKSKKYTALQI